MGEKNLAAQDGGGIVMDILRKKIILKLNLKVHTDGACKLPQNIYVKMS